MASDPVPGSSVDVLCADFQRKLNTEDESEPKSKLAEEDSYFSCESSRANSDAESESCTSDNDDDETSVLYKTASTAPVQMEDENSIAEYRVKLYRFEAEAKQWKDKGVGEIRILESVIQKNQWRVVMWVDGTGAVACNFRLFPEIIVTRDDRNPKTLWWRCFDFSDVDLPKWETFACRFPSEEQCNEFNVMIQTAVESLPPSLTKAEEEPEDGAPNCSGCIGCNPDTFEFPQKIEFHAKLEPIIAGQLESDACAESPVVVKPAIFI